MLGGAAPGSFARLDYQPSELPFLPSLFPNSNSNSNGRGREVALPVPASFEEHYLPLRDFLRTHALDGIDLDVEETTSLPGIIHLIDRLRRDFGYNNNNTISLSSSSSSPPPPSSPGRKPSFLITLAPVATALIRGMKHLSGFDYFELERLRGSRCIDWYNTQFYNGWGGLEDVFPYPPPPLPPTNPLPPSSLHAASSSLPASFQDIRNVNVNVNMNMNSNAWGWYDHIIQREGWRPERVVVGLLTNPRHGGSGYVEWEGVARVLGGLVERYPAFGGVMGWEYWGAVPELEVESLPRIEGGEREKRGGKKRRIVITGGGRGG